MNTEAVLIPYNTSLDVPFNRCDVWDKSEYDSNAGEVKHKLYALNGGTYCEQCLPQEQAKKFAYSHDGETYYGQYETREAVIAAAQKDGAAWIGECVTPDPASFIDGGSVLERIVDDSDYYDNPAFGDWPNATKEQEADLTARLQAAFNEWMDAHGLRPTFYLIENPQRVPQVQAAEGEQF